MAPADPDPAEVHQDPVRQPGRQDGRDRRGGQRQLVPGDRPHPGHGPAGRPGLPLRPRQGRCGRRPPRPHDPGRPDQAGGEKGQGTDDLHERIADDRPGHENPGADRDVPAGPGPVEHQQEKEHGHRGADVVRAAEQHLSRPGRLRRQDHPGRDQCPYRALGTASAAPGDERGEQHDQRVGQGGHDVHRFRAHPGESRHGHVLGHLGRVERDVRGPPAVQQQVAAQDVPGLEDQSGAVGVDLGSPGDPHVAEHQHDRRDQRADDPPHPPPAPRGSHRRRLVRYYAAQCSHVAKATR